MFIMQIFFFMQIEEMTDGSPAKIYCQHGRRECYYNQVHACLLDKYSFDDAFHVISCMMRGFRNVGFDRCSTLVNGSSVDQAEMTECADENSARGTALIKKYAKQTQTISLSFVPSIEADKVFDHGQQDDWLYNFDQTFQKAFEKKFKRSMYDV